jgi:predicted membrane protein
MKAFSRLVTAAFYAILFIVLASIFGFLISMFMYGSVMGTHLQARVTYNTLMPQYLECAETHGANDILCQYMYNHTQQSIRNYQNVAFWYGITSNPFIWITAAAIIGVISFMLYVQKKDE